MQQYYHEPGFWEKIRNKLLHPRQSWQGRRYGVYESDLSLVRWLDRIGVFAECAGVVDVGANVGTFSAAIAIVHPHCPIYAIEPGADAYRLLEAKARVFGRIRPFRMALGKRAETLDLHVSALSEANSFLPVTTEHIKAWPTSEPSSVERIGVERFDAWVTYHKITGSLFVKIDVQGFEAAVLEGFGGKSELVKYLLVEFQLKSMYAGGAGPAELFAQLEGMGYELHGVPRYIYSSSDRAAKPVFADFLFYRKQS
ncbi:MAG: FkbM family methyltransferase [Verrucomicrobia bacterium]|nr:FkbM family methyltransferase [Verrucomicrobiota bacterium]